jgi:hypothetical protein
MRETPFVSYNGLTRAANARDKTTLGKVADTLLKEAKKDADEVEASRDSLVAALAALHDKEQEQAAFACAEAAADAEAARRLLKQKPKRRA